MKVIRGKKLTSKEAARALGVSEASIKRWADSGLLPMEKTAGGHRRFRPEHVAAFRRENSLTESESVLRRGDSLARSKQTPNGKAAALDESLPQIMVEAIVGGHDEEAAAMLVSLHLEGHTVAHISDTVLCPALSTVGDLWHEGKLSVAQEHLATRTVLSALQTLRTSLNTREIDGKHVAICCSVEEDFHEVPVYVAALTLEAQGWGVINLGANTPFYALSEAIARFKPRLVCVASTVFNHPDRAAREFGEFIAALKRVGASVVLGGAGFQSETARRRFPADLYAETFSQLEGYASALGTDSANEDQSNAVMR